MDSIPKIYGFIKNKFMIDLITYHKIENSLLIGDDSLSYIIRNCKKYNITHLFITDPSILRKNNFKNHHYHEF